jgi:stage V sporulation protein G
MPTKHGTSGAPKNRTVSLPPNISVKIDRKVNYEGTNIKAIASANIANAFAVHGIKVCDSPKGLFVSMPSSSYKKNGQTQYSETFHAVTKDARDALNNAVLEAYEQRLHMEEGQSTGVSADESQSFGQSM